ncbi:transposase [Gluconacetobacter liquefaciens]|uniref:Transposase n=1 Tax=Gluconacetobacter liquefaciens TaxID=89584 RepID=A0A7W4PAY5_GLULI|nr:transposase [Gluconacetobacter liquefaciens]
MNFDAFMKLSSSRLRDHTWKIPTQIGRVFGEHVKWRAIPKDLPPRSTVNYYFCRWQHDGTLDRLHHALYVLCPEQADREASPTAEIIDSQSVKSAEKGRGASIRPVLTPARGSRARSGMSSPIRRAR